MEKLRIKCRSCGKELEGHSGRSYSCGCPNMATVTGNSVTARDLSDVIMLTTPRVSKTDGLTEQDMQWQEQRRKRKVRKLDFEVR